MNDLNRRTFLRNSLIAGTALLTPVSLMNLLSTPTRAQGSSPDKIRVGVIGTGSRGQHLMQVIAATSAITGLEIVALCDVYQPHMDQALALAPTAKPFEDYRRMLEMPDLHAVVVTTPLHLHVGPTVDALNNGIHVFCEKAMAKTADDVLAMAEAHYSTGKILQIGHQRLFDPKFLRGMDKIYNGELGDVTQIRAFWHRNNNWRRPVPENQPELERFINWRLYREYSCGLLTELASHHIQVANWAKKAIPVDVRGTGSISFWKDGREVDDNIALIFTYADGTQFIYDSMIQNKKYGLEVQVMGHKGTLELESNRFYMENPPPPPKPAGIVQLVQDLEKNVFRSINIGSSSWDAELASSDIGEVVAAGNNTDGTGEQFIGFANAIRNGKAIPGLFEEGYYSSIWTLLAEEAIDTGAVVRMPEKYNLNRFI
jgi:predicted dehydrogenase